MKLYLSSYHLGSRANEFAAMFANKKIAVIANALDFSNDLEKRTKSAERDLQELREIGLDPEHLDLRSYFGNTDELRQKLTKFGGVWLRGGNSFVLRKALAQSGLDTILQELRSTDFVFSGFSAGACIAAPTLKGIDLADEPEITPEGYQSEIIWDGLNLVNFSVAPHYRSDHPEASMVEESVQYFIDHKMLFIALRDGEDWVGEG